MQKVKQKLSFVVNFFKICGLILDNFKEPHKKWLKFLKYLPISIMSVYAIHVVILTVMMVKMFAIDDDFSIRTDYIGILLIITLHLRGLIDIVYTICGRKTEDKFWNLLDQLDDFFVRFLGIEINYRKENWLHLIEMSLMFIVCMTLGGFMSALNYTLTEKFNSHYGLAGFLTMMNLINIMKYIFYVSILHYRLKLVTKNFEEVRLCSCKLLTLPHVYSIAWKLSKILDKRFTIPLIFMTLHLFMTITFFGYVVAQSVVLDMFNEFYIASIVVPQVPIWIMCFYCQRISIDVSSFFPLHFCCLFFPFFFCTLYCPFPFFLFSYFQPSLLPLPM